MIINAFLGVSYKLLLYKLTQNPVFTMFRFVFFKFWKIHYFLNLAKSFPCFLFIWSYDICTIIHIDLCKYYMTLLPSKTFILTYHRSQKSSIWTHWRVASFLVRKMNSERDKYSSVNKFLRPKPKEIHKAGHYKKILLESAQNRIVGLHDQGLGWLVAPGSSGSLCTCIMIFKPGYTLQQLGSLLKGY